MGICLKIIKKNRDDNEEEFVGYEKDSKRRERKINQWKTFRTTKFGRQQKVNREILNLVVDANSLRFSSMAARKTICLTNVSFTRKIRLMNF